MPTYSTGAARYCVPVQSANSNRFLRCCGQESVQVDGGSLILDSLISSSSAKGRSEYVVAEFLRIQLRSRKVRNFLSPHNGNVTASPVFAEMRQASQISTAALP